MNDELEELLLKVLEIATANSDALALICLHLAKTDQGGSLAQTLEGIAEDPTMEKSEAFRALSRRLLQALQGDLSVRLMSIQKSDLFESTNQALHSLLNRLKGS